MKRIKELAKKTRIKTGNSTKIGLDVWSHSDGCASAKWELSIVDSDFGCEQLTFDSFQKLTDYVVLIKGV